jgi:hypothetical protein
MTYINDIYEAPVYHWIMFIKNNNLAFLQKDAINKPVNQIGVDITEESFESYHSIRDQIISEFGTDESLDRDRELDEEIALLKLDFIISKDRFKQTMYQLKEAAKKHKEEYKPYDFNKEIGIVSKGVGGGIIDIKKTTIHQYYIAKNNLKNG